MATFTNEDIRNAQEFSKVNYTLRVIRKMHETHPHIASWLQINIRDATMADYYIPATLSSACKVIDVQVPERLCNSLSCNPLKTDGPCDPTSTASYYHVGDNAYDLQCQPSCFNLHKVKGGGGDGNPTPVNISKASPSMPMLFWNPMQNACRIVDSATVAWLEKTFYRSDTKYELRKNDMPTGFSRTSEPKNQYGTGTTYMLNPTYCKYFDQELDANGSCTTGSWDVLLDLAIGKSLINSTKSSIRLVSNGGVLFALPQTVVKLPDTLPKNATLDGWLNDINPEFVVPSLIDTTPKAPTRNFVQSHHEAKESNFKDLHPDPQKAHLCGQRRHAELYNEADLSDFTRIQMGLEPKKKPNDTPNLDLKYGPYKFTNPDVAKESTEEGETPHLDHAGPEALLRQQQQQRRRRQKRNVTAEETPKADNDNDNDDDDGGNHDHSDPTKRPEWIEKVTEIIHRLLVGIFSKEMAERVAFDHVVNSTLKYMKKDLVKVIESMMKFLGESLAHITGALGERVLAVGLKSMIIRVGGQMALRMAAKTAIMIGKILGAIASVVGWVLVGAMVLDFVLTIWDPFGYKNLMPKDIPPLFALQGETNTRQMLAMPNMTYTFEYLVAAVFENQDLMIIQLESMIDTMTYLDALVVNSEGSRIDKGPEIAITKDLSTFGDATNEAMVERVRFNPVVFEEYNNKFMVRVELNRYMNYASGILLLISGGLFLIKMNVICVIFVIIAILMLALARMCIQLDAIVDILLKYRNNTNTAIENQGYAID